MKMRIFIFSIGAFLLAGCAGYHVGPIQPKSMAGVKTLAVPSFKNETLQPRLEVMAANIVIRQLQEDGTYQIASSDKADAVLEGTLKTITRSPIRSQRENVLTTTEFKVKVLIKYKVIKNGEILETRNVEGVTSFYTGNDTNEGERQAIPLALQNAAVCMVTQLSEGW